MTAAVQIQKTNKVFKLPDGNKIPAVGLGTWKSTDEDAYNSVLAALKSGYRHIDTAWAYGNGAQVGKAIKDSGVPREEIFVTSKLWCTRHNDPEKALDESLEALGLDYLDLYLIHWPIFLNPNGNDPKYPKKPDGTRDMVEDWSFVDSYRVFQKLKGTGKVKSIGVSNFSKKNLETLLNDPSTRIKPAINQIECHPYLPQNKLVQYCKEQGILVEAYSPLGSTNSPLFKDPTLIAIAEKYGVSVATLVISWAIWRETVVLPKSVTPERVDANIKTIELSDDDGRIIENLANKMGRTMRFNDPTWPIEIFNDDDEK
ncbi:hypothetical protein PACTADRAFT_71301 [Pachysolen tannophilus NRRL Y-2460]|uniref:2-dehydropantolactone reductase n=1 Tax=Pachysolen tannophilus NRRL Y-2460 TaxID=669874 RepID=A0A1E4TRW9_PACTA|nr:hypothetical protein PACTADRAFT_71301 [Pachysolen tannophilus NRRL Y-2460]